MRDSREAEVVVVLNGSDAVTPRLLAEIRDRYPAVKVEAIARASRGKGRNLGVALSSGEIVYFLDDDTIAPPGFARRVLSVFDAHPQAPFAGGPNAAPLAATPFQRAVDFALRSPWCAGPMRVRYRADGPARLLPGWCFILCNLGVRREVFASGLGFPDGCASAEENAFLWRVEKCLGRGFFAPKLCVRHERRRSLFPFIQQVFQSGQGRAQITRLEPHSLQPAVFLPPTFLGYLVGLLFLRHVALAWAPLLVYVLACMGETVRLLWTGDRKAGDAGGHSWQAACWLPLLIFSAHAAYTLGLFCGLLLSREPGAAAAPEPRLRRRADIETPCPT